MTAPRVPVTLDTSCDWTERDMNTLFGGLRQWETNQGVSFVGNILVGVELDNHMEIVYGLVIPFLRFEERSQKGNHVGGSGTQSHQKVAGVNSMEAMSSQHHFPSRKITLLKEKERNTKHINFVNHGEFLFFPLHTYLLVR